MSTQIAVFIDFENIAMWARQEFFDFELTPLIEYIKSRGALVIKRAYADWNRFTGYRDELVNNSIDLIQLFSVREAKNRADIRIALDALETAVARAQIDTFVIVSGDSDFSMLASRLREYGRYTIGIGPRTITHPLLVRSCDEFVYLETVLGELPEGSKAASIVEREESRRLLLRALQAHGQRSELPVFAGRLKQTMLSLSPAFNEANLGYVQFKSWLEDNGDIVTLFFKDLHVYVAPREFRLPPESEAGFAPAAPANGAAALPPLAERYQHAIARAGLPTVDIGTRREVLRDIFRLLSERPGVLSAEQALDELRQRYEAQGLLRSKTMLFQVWQLAFRQRAFDFGGALVSLHTPVRLSGGLDSEAAFVRQAESAFVAGIVASGLPLDEAELAGLLLNDRSQGGYIAGLLDDLSRRGALSADDEQVRQELHELRMSAALAPVLRDLDAARAAAETPRNGESAEGYARRAMLERSQDFVAAAHDFLNACRVQWDAVEGGERGATLDDLRWYLASYASVKAGERSQVHRDYAGARPYYLAFFSLVRDDDPLWGKMRGLVVPMLSYYWVNLGRELNLPMDSNRQPAEIALFAANHPNAELRLQWEAATRALADVNPSLLRRIEEQLRARPESPENTLVTGKMEQMLNRLPE